MTISGARPFGGEISLPVGCCGGPAGTLRSFESILRHYAELRTITLEPALPRRSRQNLNRYGQLQTVSVPVASTPICERTRRYAKSQMPLLQDWSRNAASPGPCRGSHSPSGSPALLCGGPVLPSDMWHRQGYCRPDGSNLESFDVFQSVNDPSADLRIDGACLGPSPSFESTGRDPPAERKFCLAEMGYAHVVSPLWRWTATSTSEITGRAGSAIALNQHAQGRYRAELSISGRQSLFPGIVTGRLKP